jgi:2-polyprenyl-3-methyl-5-hydroxy-6-metoxy-1,4-benzoquinol methylase
VSPFLKKRAAHLTEKMEDENCDKELLFNTYDQFSHVNKLISRWNSLFHAYIQPLAKSSGPLRILDLGCGGGDICLKFADWSKNSGIEVSITGIDPDPRAFEYLETLTKPANVEFRKARLKDLIVADEKFDVVISNHLLHHLTPEEIQIMCIKTEKIARKLILFNDIRRSELGFLAFGLFAPAMYRSSFIVKDGFISIRRSYNYRELKFITPERWQVKKLFPFRLLLMLDKTAH